jgi:hypothetical protein
MDLISPRPDIGYLRRRLRVGETPPAAAPRARTNFLDLSGTAPGEGRRDAPLPAKPPAVGRTVLTSREPVVRLDPRQSAIGSLRVAGSTTFAWESAERRSGVVRQGDSAADDDIPVFANRKLVEYHHGEVVVGLRHFSALRRLVIAAASGLLTLTLLDGATVLLDTEGGAEVLYLSVIGNVIEVRREILGAGRDVASVFGIHP